MNNGRTDQRLPPRTPCQLQNYIFICLLNFVFITSLVSVSSGKSSDTDLSICKQLHSDLLSLASSNDISHERETRLKKEVTECYSDLVDAIRLDSSERRPSRVISEVTKFFLSSRPRHDWKRIAKLFLLNLEDEQIEGEDAEGVDRIDSLLFLKGEKFTAATTRALLKELISLFREESTNGLKARAEKNRTLQKRLANLLSRTAELVVWIDCELAGVAFQLALKWNPSNHIANWGYGVFLTQCNSLQLTSQQKATGIAHLRKAINSPKEHGEAHRDLAECMMLIGELEEARAHFFKSAWIYPRSVDSPQPVHNYDFGSHISLENIPYKRGMVMGYLMEQQMNYNIDDKKAREDRLTRLYTFIDFEERGLLNDTERGPWILAYHTLLFPAGNRYALGAAQREAKQASQSPPDPSLPPLSPSHFSSPNSIKRVGYVSGEVGIEGHPVNGVMQLLAEGHNERGVWEAHCLQTNVHAESSSDERRSGCKFFHDISKMKPREAAAYIRKLSLNVLVDLSGHTSGTAMSFLSFQPSPIQISFLGWPSTTGASYIQYFVADRVSAPIHAASTEFTEKIIYLPHSFLFGSHSKLASYDSNKTPLPTRASESLPEHAFVFCNHGNLAKVDHTVINIWLELLERVPNSVLWLLAHKDTANHIAKFFHDRGYSLDPPNRIVFASSIPKPSHLNRLQLCDLHLDTILYSSGGTGLDVVWAGVPSITIPAVAPMTWTTPRPALKTRMMASILSTTLPAALWNASIASSLYDYKMKAINYATKPWQRYAALRREMQKFAQQNRESKTNRSILFDASKFVVSLEEGFQIAWKRWYSSKPPTNIFL